MTSRRPTSTLFPYTTLFRSWAADCAERVLHHFEGARPDDDRPRRAIELGRAWARGEVGWAEARTAAGHANRSEEHTSELQSRLHLVCRLLLEKKKTILNCRL